MSTKPFARPEENFTMLHNDIADVIMPLCSGSEFKLLMAIFRKTRGWNKESDHISYNQLMELTGIRDKTALSNAIKGLQEKNLILVQKGNQGAANQYMLNYDYEISLPKSDKNDNDKSAEIVGKPYQYGNHTGGGRETLHTKEIFKNNINATTAFENFLEIYQDQFHKEPKVSPEEVDKVEAMLADNVSASELAQAFREMEDKGYACPAISSAHAWILNNRASKKRTKTTPNRLPKRNDKKSDKYKNLPNVIEIWEDGYDKTQQLKDWKSSPSYTEVWND